MNAQIMTAVTALSLLVLTGCNGGLRNMLYGRGAACGACAAAGPQYNIAAPGPCGPQTPCGGGRCGSGFGGDDDGYGGVSAYAPAIGGTPYGEMNPGFSGEYPGGIYPGSGYGYPAPGQENDWVPAGEAIVPGSSYMSEPITPMAGPAR